MSSKTSTNINKTLDEIFHHNHQIRKLEAKLLNTKNLGELTSALTTATNRESAAGEVEKLEVLARLWSQIGSEKSVQILLDMLGSDVVEIKEAAGQALIDLTDEHFEIFAKTLSAALKSSDKLVAVADDLATILAELEKEEVTELLLAMLSHQSPQMVAAALTIAGGWGWDEKVFKSLTKLTKDNRKATLEDEHEGEVIVEVSELATEVLGSLRSLKQGLS